MKKVIEITATINIVAGLFILGIAVLFDDWRLCASATFFMAFGAFGCPLLIRLIEK